MFFFSIISRFMSQLLKLCIYFLGDLKTLNATAKPRFVIYTLFAGILQKPGTGTFISISVKISEQSTLLSGLG